MPGTFLEDLTRAGRAVWEHYLSPFTETKADEPPLFPVWAAAPVDDIEHFVIKYRRDFEWRAWLGWGMAFSTMAMMSASAKDTAEGFLLLDKFSELVAIHMGERCPGGHEESIRESMSIMATLPEYHPPTWTYGSGDMQRFRFEVAAHQEWLYLQGTFVPGRELSDERQQEVLDLSSEIENDLFREATFETLVGLMVLSMHMAATGLEGYSAGRKATAKKILCVQAHGVVDANKHYMFENSVSRMMNALFPFPFNPELN